MPAAENSMLFWLARAAKELREAADRKQVHIAASIDKDQSTIYRFEQARAWPRQADLIVAGYADDLDIDDARTIWRRALELWEAEGNAPSLPDLMSEADAFGQALDDASRASAKSPASRARTQPAKATRRRAG